MKPGTLVLGLVLGLGCGSVPAEVGGGGAGGVAGDACEELSACVSTLDDATASGRCGEAFGDGYGVPRVCSAVPSGIDAPGCRDLSLFSPGATASCGGVEVGIQCCP